MDKHEDLADQLGAMFQYITYAAKATGPYRPQLSAFFLNEVSDEQGDAQYLSNKIVALGGEPARFRLPSPIARWSKRCAILRSVRLPTTRIA
jgi:bacterioferritin